MANSELSQLRRNAATVIRLVAWLPPKLRSTYLVGASDAQQKFWVGVFAKMPRHKVAVREVQAGPAESR